jgi:hypothetical protein
MRLPSAYVLAHNGLGDNVCMFGCLHFLANFYDDIYFICRAKFESQVKYALADWPFIHVVPVNSDVESEEAVLHKALLRDKYQDSDVFVGGFLNTHHSRTKVTHPFLRDPAALYRAYPGGIETFMRECYVDIFPKIRGQYHYTYTGVHSLPRTYEFIDMFYRDMGLNTAISYDWFAVSAHTDALELYQPISNYNIIFVHTTCGMEDKKFNFAAYVEPYLGDDRCLVVCSDRNYYKPEDSQYSIAQKYIMLPTIFHYMEILKKAEVLIMTDSCISCLATHMMKKGEIKTNDVVIVNRFIMQVTDLSWFMKN